MRLGRLVLWALMLAASSSVGGAADQPLIYASEVDALIHPISSRYMVEAIRRADADRAALVVFTLRTPGGLLDSARAINSAIIGAKTPVAVWVGPSGARAASAGFLITLAADVAAMAPGTHIGAAHPVSGTGESMNETLSKKAASDVAADARTLASNRGRNVELAEAAVLESRSFTEREALEATPPLIDAIVPSVDDLIKLLDGRTVKRFDGHTIVLQTKNARVIPLRMNWRERFLSGIAHPNIAYLLLSLGTLGLTIELWNPGAILPGVVGGICLLLAFFAFQILPVNYAGLALVLFGILLLVLEIKVTSFGLLTVGGIASLLFGSFMLIDSTAPELQVSLRVILPVVAALSGILIFLVQIAITAQRRRSVTGESGMIDQMAVMLTAIGPGEIGRVRARGEIWNATASEPIAVGEPVRVTSVDGLTLTVRRAKEPS
ncbi:MAG: nodulation protein NfeD [Acidobacteria bacterium]|nr:nodulation protein NfeD [Acidobacteriota bacterium]